MKGKIVGKRFRKKLQSGDAFIDELKVQTVPVYTQLDIGEVEPVYEFGGTARLKNGKIVITVDPESKLLKAVDGKLNVIGLFIDPIAEDPNQKEEAE